MVTSRQLAGNWSRSCINLRKWIVSFTNDGRVKHEGFRKKSMNSDMCSVGQLLADMMGLPGGGVFPLWILGSKYSCGVR